MYYNKIHRIEKLENKIKLRKYIFNVLGLELLLFVLKFL